MKWIRFTLLVMACTLLQAALFANFSYKPNLLLIIMVFFAIYADPFHAVITAFVTGFAADIVTDAMGPHMILYTVLGTLLSNLSGVISIKRMPYQAATIFIVGIAIVFLRRWLLALAGQPLTEPLHLSILISPALSALVGPFIFLPVAWLMQIKSERKRRYH